jgi:mitogen-activated protein kinase kinase
MQPQVKKQVLRELEILHHCDSPYIVSFFGAFLSEPDVCMCMELMDVGSLDSIYKKYGPIPVPILGKITIAVLGGLVYLYENHRIIHRGKITNKQLYYK